MYDLRDQILQLNPADRANLLALVERDKVTAPYTPSREDSEVWDTLVKLCSMRHRNLDAFLRDKQEGLARRQWSEAVALIGRFCAQAAPVRHRDLDRAALVDLVLECLAADLRAHHERVTAKTLLAAVPDLPAAVDRAFPGYVAAGLLHKLIRLAGFTR